MAWCIALYMLFTCWYLYYAIISGEGAVVLVEAALLQSADCRLQLHRLQKHRAQDQSEPLPPQSIQTNKVVL